MLFGSNFSKNSFYELWKGEINGKNTVIVEFTKFLETTLRFYFLGKKNALCFNCTKKLPIAINDYLNSIENKESIEENSAFR